jgi:hypothetical protein
MWGVTWHYLHWTEGEEEDSHLCRRMLWIMKSLGSGYLSFSHSSMSSKTKCHRGTLHIQWRTLQYCISAYMFDGAFNSVDFEKTTLETETMAKDVNDMDTITRFFHELIFLAFDIYSAFLQNVFNVSCSLVRERRPLSNFVPPLYWILSRAATGSNAGDPYRRQVCSSFTARTNSS